jgi:hypothetical protein
MGKIIPRNKVSKLETNVSYNYDLLIFWVILCYALLEKNCKSIEIFFLSKSLTGWTRYIFPLIHKNNKEDTGKCEILRNGVILSITQLVGT